MNPYKLTKHVINSLLGSKSNDNWISYYVVSTDPFETLESTPFTDKLANDNLYVKYNPITKHYSMSRVRNNVRTDIEVSKTFGFRLRISILEATVTLLDIVKKPTNKQNELIKSALYIITYDQNYANSINDKDNRFSDYIKNFVEMVFINNGDLRDNRKANVLYSLTDYFNNIT